MTTETQSLRDDLAFLRALVEPGDGGQRFWRAFGETYLAAGACYGAQILLTAGQAFGVLPAAGWVSLASTTVPTAVFIGLLVWILTARRNQSTGGGVVSRAVGSLFGILGLANVGLAAAIGSVAWREHSLTTWLIYPSCVYILQGAAWLVALSLRRRRWHGWVAAGWIVLGLGMAAAIANPVWYLAFALAGLVFCMALPGWAMMRGARAPAPSAASNAVAG